jgi:hypothetical protein
LALCAAGGTTLPPRTPQPPLQPLPPWRPSIVVFSGGTAWNCLASALSQDGRHCAYILPVSDDGGSTSEIRRVFGGPAIGDLRSRLSRVQPPSPTPAQLALQRLLRYRLDEESETRAREEWCGVLSSDHCLWKGEEGQEYEWAVLARSVLQKLNAHVVSALHRRGDGMHWANASVGNLLLTALRLRMESLDAAISWISHYLGVDSSTLVLPCSLDDDGQEACCRAALSAADSHTDRHTATQPAPLSLSVERDTEIQRQRDAATQMATCASRTLPAGMGGGLGGGGGDSTMGDLGIGVVLKNGRHLVGQSAISHPVPGLQDLENLATPTHPHRTPTPPHHICPQHSAQGGGGVVGDGGRGGGGRGSLAKCARGVSAGEGDQGGGKRGGEGEEGGGKKLHKTARMSRSLSVDKVVYSRSLLSYSRSLLCHSKPARMSRSISVEKVVYLSIYLSMCPCLCIYLW